MLNNMSRFIFAITFCFCATLIFSQGMAPAAPDVVLKGFIKNYGNEKATWKHTDSTYEATFKLVGMPAIAWFDSTGHRTKVKVEITTEQVPAIAKSYIDRNYPKAKITKAWKWTDDKPVNTFQAEIKLGAETKNFMFTSRGDFIKEVGKE